METYITKDLVDAESNMGAKSDILRQSFNSIQIK